jgi:hypothetical protein
MNEFLAVVVADPVKAMLIKIWSYIPAVAGSIVILVIGWLVAKLIEAIVVRVLKMVKLDMASEKAGIAKVLAQGDIRVSLSELLGVITYWVVMLITIVTMLNALNLTVAANLLSRLVEYIPNIITAIFALVLGLFLASFVSTIVKTAAANAGLGNSKLLAQVAQIVLVIFAVAVSVEQLKISAVLVGMTINIILASIGLGLALAFGLGCKDIAAKTMQELLNKLKK